MIAYGYRQCSSNLQTPKRVKSIPTSDSEHLSLASTHKSPKALTFEHSMRGTELRRDSSADFGHKVGGNTSSSNSSIRYISDKVNLARAEFSCRLQDQKRESERARVCVKISVKLNTSIDYAEQQSFSPMSSTRICLTSSFKIEDPLHSTRNTTSLFFSHYVLKIIPNINDTYLNNSSPDTQHNCQTKPRCSSACFRS